MNAFAYYFKAACLFIALFALVYIVFGVAGSLVLPASWHEWIRERGGYMVPPFIAVVAVIVSHVLKIRRERNDAMEDVVSEAIEILNREDVNK